MRAMILAAGYGTRLGTLSDERPKVLLPMCDQPLIRFALALVRGAGIREVVVNLHHKGELVEAELGDGASAGVHVTYSREPHILGTGGGVKQAAPLLGDDTFVVVNGKVVIDLDLQAAIAAHRRAGALATMVVRRDPDAARWGAIDVAEDGRIRQILGAGEYMFTGVHVIEPELLGRIPDGEQCIIRTAYQGALRDGARVHAFVQQGYFAEHSTPARYVDGNVALLRGAAAPTTPGPLRGVDPTAILATGATIRESVRIGPRARIGSGAAVGPDVVVGHDAEVTPGASLRECVVWDGSRAVGHLQRAIVTPAGVHRL
jgi:mannose-1-phosphate guanylyltransferase